MSKKIFLLFFTLFTFSLKVPVYDFENAGIYYTVSSRQKYTVAVTSSPQQRSAYRGEIVVPPSVVYEGKTFRVTEISKRAFQGCAQLVSLTVPASVVEIGDSAFFACTGLKYLVLEDGEKPLRVGSNSYHGVSAGQAIFHDCPLETLYLGRELQYEGGFFYGYSPFYKKKELSLVVVGDGVRTLENRAFYGCESLESVTIGGRVASVGNFAFYACKMLKELVVKEGNLPLEIGTNGNGKNLFSDAPLETLYLGRDLHYPESVGEIYNPFFQKGTLRTVTMASRPGRLGRMLFKAVILWFRLRWEVEWIELAIGLSVVVFHSGSFSLRMVRALCFLASIAIRRRARVKPFFLIVPLKLFIWGGHSIIRPVISMGMRLFMINSICNRS